MEKNVLGKTVTKTNQKEFIVEKVTKKKGDQTYAKWKGYDNFLIVGLIKKT